MGFGFFYFYTPRCDDYRSDSAGIASLQELPVDQLIPQVMQQLAVHGSLVLRAATGAGKTTRIPPAVAAAAQPPHTKVILLEPRRVAAKAAASRMAAERGERPGESIGYRVRFDEQCSADTKIVAVTEGILLRQMQTDPYLEGINTVILDEFHERRLDSDLCLAMLTRIRQTVRPDLQLVVMSATMDPGPIATFLNNCPVIDAPGRSFPVKILWKKTAHLQRLPDLAAEGTRELLGRTQGDILVFLPGKGEIHRTANLLRPLAEKHNFTVLPLHGSLPLDQQNEVLNPSDVQRVILSTNVAETSVTVAGVTAVVDTGMARQLSFDADSGINQLQLRQISKASADQRAGRAGRTQPGVCLRLWDQHRHRTRPDQEAPEIQRTDLSAALLKLIVWGETDFRAFPWFQPPPEDAVEQGKNLLQILGAVDDSHQITPIGRWMSRFPIAPRLSRVIIAAYQSGHGMRSCLMAALISEQAPFLLNTAHAAPRDQLIHHSESDVVDRVRAVEDFLNEGRQQSRFGEIHRNQLRTTLQTTHQLAEVLDGISADIPSGRQIPDSDEALMRALLTGYPDRLAVRKDLSGDRGLMTGGRQVRLAKGSAVRSAALFLCINVDGAGAKAEVRQASGIEYDWLPQEQLVESEDLFFHPTRRQVLARKRTSFLELVLKETPTAVTDHEKAAELLFNAASPQLNQLLPPDDSAAMKLLMRIGFLKQSMPELELPEFGHDQMLICLRQLCYGLRSTSELKEAPWKSVFEQQLSRTQREAVITHAPETITVPSGSRIALTYRADGPPILGVRIQEIFGLRATPAVAAGRVQVLLHLLGPNHRPQQVTDDLASFWQNTYPVIRRDLARRYPRHPWPEDPLNASPIRK